MMARYGVMFRFRGTGGPSDEYIKLLVSLVSEFSNHNSISPLIETGGCAPPQEP